MLLEEMHSLGDDSTERAKVCSSQLMLPFDRLPLGCAPHLCRNSSLKGWLSSAQCHVHAKDTCCVAG